MTAIPPAPFPLPRSVPTAALHSRRTEAPDEISNGAGRDSALSEPLGPPWSAVRLGASLDSPDALGAPGAIGAVATRQTERGRLPRVPFGLRSVALRPLRRGEVRPVGLGSKLRLGVGDDRAAPDKP